MEKPYKGKAVGILIDSPNAVVILDGCKFENIDDMAVYCNSKYVSAKGVVAKNVGRHAIGHRLSKDDLIELMKSELSQDRLDQAISIVNELSEYKQPRNSSKFRELISLLADKYSLVQMVERLFQSI